MDKIENKIKELLEYIGEDVNREGLKDTPVRVAKMYKEIFRGYDITTKPKIAIFDNSKDGIKYDQVIYDSGYFFFALRAPHRTLFWGVSFCLYTKQEDCRFK